MGIIDGIWSLEDAEFVFFGRDGDEERKDGTETNVFLGDGYGMLSCCHNCWGKAGNRGNWKLLGKQ